MPGIADLLKSGVEAGLKDQSFEQGYNTASKERQAKLEHQLKEQGAQQRMSQIEQLIKKYPKSAISMTAEGAAIHPLNTETADLRRQALEQKGMADYSKRLEKTAPMYSDLQELENLTNRDGNGGVLSNPNAQLKSTGKVYSALGSRGLGLATLTGAVPKEVAAERKVLDRLLVDYQQSKSGVRVSDAARRQEKDALGWLASADPQLVAKGVRSLARAHKETLSRIQGGYPINVRDAVHSQSGDPMELLHSIHNDNEPAPKTKEDTSGFDPNSFLGK